MMKGMSTPDGLRIASYNVRKCVGLDRRRRPERIIEVINALDADLIALQEADRRLGPRPAAIGREMIERETDFAVLDLGGDGPSIGWHGNAILLRRGLNGGAVELIALPGTEPRGAVALDVGALRVVATHLGLLRRDRRRQLDAIARHLGARAGRSVILGDFNEWTRRRGLEPLAEAFVVHSPGRSYHAARPLAALDRVATGREIRLQDAGVHDTALSRVASDHLPIWADLAPAA